MSVEWKLVQKTLGEINDLPDHDQGNQLYEVEQSYKDCDNYIEKKNKCIFDLFFAGYILAYDVSSGDTYKIMAPVLSDVGLKLLGVLGDKNLWSFVNEHIEECGEQLDLDSVRDFGLPAI